MRDEYHGSQSKLNDETPMSMLKTDNGSENKLDFEVSLCYLESRR